MEFDYQRDTRAHYQNDDVARRYHDAYTGKVRSLSSLRVRLVARWERKTVARFLSQVPHQTVLDLPSGTGKLAPILVRLGARVTACDISGNMLDIARQVYETLGYENVAFHVCDAEHAADISEQPFDTVVCLRLLHRVPLDAKDRILAQLASTARYAIVSMSVDSPYQRIRTRVRRFIFPGMSPIVLENRADSSQRLEKKFEVVDARWISRLFSREMVFLLRSKAL
jgi:ubiquinone/menaquinone biosynthesis C-methylase UbiE